MKKRALAILLAFSMVFSNTVYLYASEATEERSEQGNAEDTAVSSGETETSQDQDVDLPGSYDQGDPDVQNSEPDTSEALTEEPEAEIEPVSEGNAQDSEPGTSEVSEAEPEPDSEE